MIETKARKTASTIARRVAWDSHDFEPILIDSFEHCVTAEHDLTSD